MPVVIDIDEAPTLDLSNGRGKIILLFNPKNYTKNVDVHITTRISKMFTSSSRVREKL